MDCAEALRVQAYFDGELDATDRAQIERHVQTCVECQARLKELDQIRSWVRPPGASLTVPAPLRAKIGAALDREAASAAQVLEFRRPAATPRARPFWTGVISGIGGSAVAAALGFLVVAPLFNSPLPGELVADHTHSLMASHLIDVVSTDQHTVKPWFAGRIDVSPVVADFAPAGYRLLGGRVDELGHQKAAVIVYQHGRHFINVFSWALGAGAVPRNSTRNGYHLYFWKMGDLGYCAVSDTGWDELQGLVHLMQEQGARETAP